MIKEIRVGNIRLFEGTGWSFPLSPLTVFCGTNNSGKSTLLKVLLLLRQSMGIEESYSYEEGKLRFFGSQVDMGSYRSLVSHNEHELDMSIGLTTEGHMPRAVASSLRSLRAPGKRASGAASEDSVLYSLESDFRFGLITELERASDIAKVSEEDLEAPIIPSPEGVLKSAASQLRIDDETLLRWRIEYSGLDEDGDPRFDLVIPEAYFDGLEQFSELRAKREPRGHARVRVFLRDLRPMAVLARSASEDETVGGRDQEEEIPLVPVPRIIYNLANVHLQQTLHNIHYIGPLRSPAERYYMTRPDVEQPLDPAGKFLPLSLIHI